MSTIPTTEELLERLRALKPEFPAMNIKRMALFGSYARGEATEDSDVDLLIDLSNEDTSLFDLIDRQHALEDKLHHTIDLVTFDTIHPALKDRIMKEAKHV